MGYFPCGGQASSRSMQRNIECNFLKFNLVKQHNLIKKYTNSQLVTTSIIWTGVLINICYYGSDTSIKSGGAKSALLCQT